VVLYRGAYFSARKGGDRRRRKEKTGRRKRKEEAAVGKRKEDEEEEMREKEERKRELAEEKWAEERMREITEEEEMERRMRAAADRKGGRWSSVISTDMWNSAVREAERLPPCGLESPSLRRHRPYLFYHAPYDARQAVPCRAGVDEEELK
jgi:hypothetical protein